ncbi:lysophospholipase [bacterium]|nr:lysophospholipase [Akkermansiaceae bacterium]MDB4288911.1 lysophospholipase [bacterium]MDA7538363.1 lysophospholipase [Akkermansiaceae bacterium]MDB0068647.1 lysophospholipase [Akkermansiaceae bacterium]MDB4275666.1 lysophospholipase [Akkermansiaceae bacterium]
MIVESQKITLAGHQLHRLILKPEGLSQGSLVFFHGQGDFIDRYPSILEIFVENGITCILTDLPGHGQSSAKRGHVPGFDFVDLLLEDSLENLTGPFGIAGHSMGGMLAIRALLKNPDRFDYAWISSPLLAPARQGSPLMRILLPQIARYLPWLTWSTGVTTEQCRSGPSTEPERDALYHSKISLGWVHELLIAAQELEATFPSLPTDLPILFTQGSADPVCPAEILRDRLAKLPKNEVTYLEIPEALHEPFIGENGETIRRTLSEWIK